MPDATHLLISEHKEELDDADRYVLETMAELGAAYLRLRQAELELSRARASIAGCSAEAEHADAQRKAVMDRIAKEMDLPPGRYVYNTKTGRLELEGDSAR